MVDFYMPINTSQYALARCWESKDGRIRYIQGKRCWVISLGPLGTRADLHYLLHSSLLSTRHKTLASCEAAIEQRLYSDCLIDVTPVRAPSRYRVIGLPYSVVRLPDGWKAERGVLCSVIGR